MLRIFEAELVGNLADGQTGLDEQLLETHHGTFLIVVLLASVAYRTAVALLQEQRIQAVVLCKQSDQGRAQPRVVLVAGHRIGVVRHRHQRVQRLPSVQFVVRINAVYLDDSFVCHNVCKDTKKIRNSYRHR